MAENSIKFHNTRSHVTEDFNPISSGKVGMYHCGPTVYGPAHLGNLCPFIYWDVMRRGFEALDYEVNQVMNFTDIGHIIADEDSGDDKMVSALVKAGKKLTIENLHAHGKEIAALYLKDLEKLNILTPHHLPYASQHIDEDIALIEKLEQNGFAYQTPSAVYFDTQKDPNYDAFNVHGDLDIDHQRLEAETDKKHPRDFALWKLSRPTAKQNNETESSTDNTIGWPSPWGVGFPGWHIECSAMSWRYLGKSFDIHTGGIEHIAVHHTNEIAQSEHAFPGTTMANYWLHNNHLQLNGQKIAKSDGNVIYLDELDTMGLHPMDFRYLILTSHYRSEQNLTIESLRGTREARKSLYNLLKPQSDSIESITNPEFDQEILNILFQDLDTAGAIAAIRTKLKSADLTPANRQAIFNTVDQVLGIKFDDLKAIANSEIDPEVQKLATQRQLAKDNQDYVESDNLRAQILKLGYEIRDNDGVQEIYPTK